MIDQIYDALCNISLSLVPDRAELLSDNYAAYVILQVEP